MGLTLHYKLSAPAVIDPPGARALVARMRAAAMAMKRADRIDAVGQIDSSPAQLAWLSEWLLLPAPGAPDTTHGIVVPARTGFVFNVMLGDDSEPLRLGLCRFATRVKDPATGRMRSVRRDGWRLAGFCKTQYAGLHGWEHFRRCHVAAVELLAGLAALGIEVEITDEGGFWPARDEVALRRNLDRSNGIVAAFAGTMKDATDEDGGPPVRSPIFSHPHFERIEAEGLARNGKMLRAAVAQIRKLRA